MTYKFIDLFAGIGGIKKGLTLADFECVYSNDIDPYCKQTFDLNFKLPLDTSGIKAIDPFTLPEYQILAGGFPCQAFSIAGYRKGFDDEGRGDLFFDICRLLEQRPVEAFLLENVKNLVSHDYGNTIKIIHKHLQDAGYFSTHHVLNTMDYANLPQNRERVYIVGFRSHDALKRFEFPEKVPLSTQLVDVLEKHKVDDSNLQKTKKYSFKQTLRKLH